MVEIKRLEKCCFCCSLKYGFYTFGILSLASTVSVIVLLYWTLNFLEPKSVARDKVYVNVLGPCLGWLIASGFCIYLALKGIIQERSILMYPYTVTILVELVGAISLDIALAVLLHPLYLLGILVHLCLILYPAICLISLYLQFRQKEKEVPVQVQVRK